LQHEHVYFFTYLLNIDIDIAMFRWYRVDVVSKKWYRSITTHQYSQAYIPLEGKAQ